MYWLVLNKQGNSSQRERIALLPRFIGRFGRRGILGILGDREFIGDQGWQWLSDQDIPYLIRMKENQLLTARQGHERPVRSLFGLGGGQKSFTEKKAPHRSTMGIAQRHEAGQRRTLDFGRQPPFPAATGSLWLALGNRASVPMPERPWLSSGRDTAEADPLFSDQKGDGVIGPGLLLGA